MTATNILSTKTQSRRHHVKKTKRTASIVPAEKIESSPVLLFEEKYHNYTEENFPPTKSHTQMPENFYLCKTRPNGIKLSPKKLFNAIPEAITPFFHVQEAFPHAMVGAIYCMFHKHTLRTFTTRSKIYKNHQKMNKTVLLENLPLNIKILHYICMLHMLYVRYRV